MFSVMLAAALTIVGPKESVLVVGGHPDDLVGSAGLCLLMKDRFDVHLADFTRGDRSQKRGAELAPLAKRRTAEELAACRLAGITPHFIDEINGLAFASQEACERLSALIASLKPRAIIMHWPIDIHMDHVMSTAATLKALEMAKLKRAPELIFFEETWQSKNFSVHRLVDITAVWPKKAEIIRAYACQNINDAIVENKYRDAKFRGSQLFPPEDGRMAEAYSVYQAPVQGVKSIFDELPPPGPLVAANDGRFFEGAELAPGNVHAPELCKLKNCKDAPGDPIVLVKGGAKLPVVYAPGDDEWWAAKQIAETLFEMTGFRPQLIRERAGRPVTNAPALYVGATTAAKKAGLEAPKDHPEAFRVVAKGGSIYFLGKSAYAVVDWLERQLGARHYWPMKPCDLYGAKGTNCVWGKTYVKTDGLAVKPLDWNDRPRYGYRENWPYDHSTWDRWARGGNSHRGGVAVHQPDGWWKEKDALDHVEIFALSDDGKRPYTSLLCYGNPKTLAYYEMRTRQGIEAWKAYQANTDPKKGRFKDPSGGILNYRQRVVTISQADCGVKCACEYCRKLFDEKSAAGSGSPIIWGYFTRAYAKWLKENYPDWKIAILPYINTCEIPPDPEDPTKPLDLARYGNVEAMLCTMPGLALLKNDACKKHEEDLIRRWVRCTGNPVLNWHYSCWPSEITSAPYVFGKTAQRHYRDMGDQVCGSFLNGTFDTARFTLSVYVWMKCLWNPDFDVEALYDDFANRMFGKAAKPMRELIRMQEDGWNRQWGSNLCSIKNVFKVSYPRAEVKRMAALLAEAEVLAKGDGKAMARLAWYRSGFTTFFKESEENESGKAFAPMMMKKAVSQPKVDGKLDDACWKVAEPRDFVSAQCKTNSKPLYATQARVVWYPGETGGLTFGFRCEEPATKIMKQGVSGDTWGQDNIEIFLDASGSGDGHFYHPIIDATGRVSMYTTVPNWAPKNTKTGVFIGDGWWSMEVFVPFSDLKDFPNARLPTTSANGIVWTGNFNRWRVGDCSLPKDKRAPGSKQDWSRLNTRYNFWNKDPAAFGPFKFVE